MHYIICFLFINLMFTESISLPSVCIFAYAYVWYHLCSNQSTAKIPKYHTSDRALFASISGAAADLFADKLS